jgi:uncharacterized OB-fold protein
MQKGEEVGLSAAYLLKYDYKRTLGPILTQFFTGLRDGRVLGIRAADGRVVVPPQEYDPVTGASLSEMVEVRDSGVVKTWAWVAQPREKHPLDRPFAWALIQLDGADTAMLHVVEAASMDAMRTGMRVKATWAPERVGYMTDIVSFHPEEGSHE